MQKLQNCTGIKDYQKLIIAQVRLLLIICNVNFKIQELVLGWNLWFVNEIL